MIRFNRKLWAFLPIIIALIMPGCVHSDTGEQNNLPGKNGSQATAALPSPARSMQLLREGNKRYINNRLSKNDENPSPTDGLTDQAEQPLAVILTCTDDTIVPEVVFDQIEGRLVVVRAPGLALDQTTVLNVEYELEVSKAPLLVILGHENCKFIKNSKNKPPDIENNVFMDKFAAAIAQAENRGLNDSLAREKVIDDSIMAGKTELEYSPAIKNLLGNNSLSMVTAKYYSGSGEVVFFPESTP